MKIVKVISMICVLALALTLVSGFAFAAAPEPDVKVPQEGTRTGGVHYVVRTATHMYVDYDLSSAYACPSLIPVGAHLVRQNGVTYSGGWYKMMYNSYVGYIPASRLTEVQ